MRDRRHHRHHPWKEFGLLSDWKIEWTDDLPFGVWGHTDFDTKTVYLANGMNEAERRCTIEHERHHVLRGPVPRGCEMREELLVDRLAARKLLPSVRHIGHVMAWHNANVQRVAHELWVDETMFHVRLSALRPSERDWLTEQMDTILV